MKIVIISGSHRTNSMSRKVADWIANHVQTQWEDSATVVDLAEAGLPMWDDDIWDKAPRWDEAFGAIGEQLSEADALVTICPEWAGMATPGIKNFFLLCTNDMVGHKPSLLVSVSASRGGAYPIAELRMSSYKNNHVCHIPEHVIVRNCRNLLTDEEPVDKNDAYTRERLHYALGLLRIYGEALQHVRSSGLIDYKTYPFGQ